VLMSVIRNNSCAMPGYQRKNAQRLWISSMHPY
jgi:hypothetical protein